MIEVELWDRDGMPFKYVQIAAPLQEICVPQAVGAASYTLENTVPDVPRMRFRRFRYHGKSVDITELGISVILVYKEI